MAERSRIKLNPSTMEIEIEGSEAFVRNSFNNIQEFFFKVQGKEVKKPAKPQKTIKPVRTAKKEKAKPVAAKKVKHGSITRAVMKVIAGSPKGASVSAIMKKTGLKPRQIFAATKVAKKEGKIKTKTRGVYISA